ncbi:MAG: hypothetical protein ACHQK9_23580, partial [Reyranellales bacterium]
AGRQRRRLVRLSLHSVPRDGNSRRRRAIVAATGAPTVPACHVAPGADGSVPVRMTKTIFTGQPR